MNRNGQSMRRKHHFSCQSFSTTLLLTQLILGLLSTLSTQKQHQHSPFFAHAQSIPYFTPIAVSAPAFARTITKLYVAGGAWTVSPEFNSRQFMFLDLLVSFNTTAPAWTKLADGPLQRLFPAAFSADERDMYVFHIDGTNSPWKYDVKEDRWQEVNASTARFQNAGWEGIGAVTDPTTGLIYLAGGYDDVSATAKALKVLNIFDPISQTIHTDDLPDPERAFPMRWYYGNVWSRNRSSVIYWGGNNREPTNLPLGPVENAVTEMMPNSSMKWYTIPIQGVAPAVRADHCMAANEDGTRIIIYGGRIRNNTVVGELWIFNVVSSTWTPGKSGPLRMYAACTVAGDQFILWGGSSAQSVVAQGEMIIYNLTAGEYQKEYTPPEWYKGLVPPLALSRTTAPWATPGQEGTMPHGGGGEITGSVKSGNGAFSAGSSGAIAGGVIGGMTVIGLVAGLFFARKRQKRQGLEGEGQGSEKSEQTEQGGTDDFRDNGQDVAEREGPWKNDPQTTARHDPQAAETNYGNVDRALQELVEQQRELEHKRQLLVLKHQGLTSNNITSNTDSSSKTELPQQQQLIRSPAFFAGAKTEYYSPPPPTPASIHWPSSIVVSSEAFCTDTRK